jgi:hypothetical protein
LRSTRRGRRVSNMTRPPAAHAPSSSAAARPRAGWARRQPPASRRRFATRSPRPSASVCARCREPRPASMSLRRRQFCD